MIENQIFDLASSALKLALVLSAPAVLAALLIGLTLSLLQAATQLQEQTLVTVAKIVAVNVVLLVCGYWMLCQLKQFLVAALEQIARANL
jgi:flagellar biosynthetic protein FliQ